MTWANSRTWEDALRQAHAGEPRLLLSLLLHPASPGQFNQLPDDELLRFRVVKALVTNNWKATSLEDLFTKTGWGRTKLKLSDHEVGAVSIHLDASETKAEADALLESLAAEYGLEPETLRKRIKSFRRMNNGP